LVDLPSAWFANLTHSGPSHLIATDRLHCSIDKVHGVVETICPGMKTTQYETDGHASGCGRADCGAKVEQGVVMIDRCSRERKGYSKFSSRNLAPRLGRPGAIGGQGEERRKTGVSICNVVREP
jgi:hypothetical protein